MFYFWCMIYYKEKLATAINAKIFADQQAKQKRIGVRDAAEESGVSSATISRAMASKIVDIETFAKLVTWLGHVPQQYIY